VKAIVNQPVEAIPRTPDARIWVYSPGWFHPGAQKPDFLRVDIRKTQNLQYGKHEYVSSDINPAVMFRGRDIEFNAMTKFFCEDRSLPKKRLTEEEMLEVNRLYRVIGKAESERDARRPSLPTRGTAATTGSPDRAPLLESAVAVVFLLGIWLLYRRFGREAAR
jgi:hypothetical protein